MRPLVVLFFVVASALAAPHVEKRSASHLAYSAPIYETVGYAAAPVATVYSGGSAVSHQSRVDVKSSPAVYAAAPAVYAAAPAVYAAAPAVVHEPVAYAAVPVGTTYVGGSAVSHQSRVDVSSSPAIVASAPVVSPVVEARAYYAAPAAVSHQSRYDARSSPALVAADPAWAPAVYASAW